MIPVKLKREPRAFDVEVRQPGHKWLTEKKIPLNAPPPNASDLPTYWRLTNKRLWKAYSGVCAYLAIYFEWVSGAASTDHFVAKSRNAGDAYEWNNYRLALLGPNRLKNNYDDVLDPVGLRKETFLLNFLSGKIRPNSLLDPQEKKAALKTIARLKLNSPEHKKMRVRHYRFYKGSPGEKVLRKLSPFVWYEARRQNLL